MYVYFLAAETFTFLFLHMNEVQSRRLALVRFKVRPLPDGTGADVDRNVKMSRASV